MFKLDSKRHVCWTDRILLPVFSIAAVAAVACLFLLFRTNQGELCLVLKEMMEDQRGSYAQISYYKEHPEELTLVEIQLEKNINRLPC